MELNANVHTLMAWAHERGETMGRLQAKNFEQDKELKRKDALLEATKADLDKMEATIEGLNEEIGDLLTECEQLKASRDFMAAELNKHGVVTDFGYEKEAE